MMLIGRNKDVKKRYSDEENCNQSNEDYNASGIGLQISGEEAHSLILNSNQCFITNFCETSVMLDLIVTYYVKTIMIVVFSEQLQISAFISRKFLRVELRNTANKYNSRINCRHILWKSGTK